MPELNNTEQSVWNFIETIWKKTKDAGSTIVYFRSTLICTTILLIASIFFLGQISEFSSKDKPIDIINIAFFVLILFPLKIIIFLIQKQRLENEYKIRLNYIYNLLIFFHMIVFIIFLYIFTNKNLTNLFICFILMNLIVIIIYHFIYNNKSNFLQILAENNARYNPFQNRTLMNLTIFVIVSIFSISFGGFYTKHLNSLFYFVLFIFILNILLFVISYHADEKNHRLPFVSVIFIWFLLGSSLTSNNEIRTLSDGFEPTKYEDFLDATPNDADPLVIIASSGGGIRAGAWTYAVLNQLSTSKPEFESHVVGISSVSGASLGGMAWVADRKGQNQGCKFDAQSFFASDFLSEVLRGFLFIEVIDRFSFGLASTVTDWAKNQFRQSRSVLRNRADTLRQSWEEAWQDSVTPKGNEKCHQLNKTVEAIWYDDGKRNNLPPLFTNGVDVATGRRVITSPDDLSGIIQDSYHFFNDADPAHIYASEMILNSARFTYISPSGKLVTKNQTRLEIVDGGYFDNFGANTAIEVYEKVRTKFSKRKILIIQITNGESTRTVKGVNFFGGQDKCFENYPKRESSSDNSYKQPLTSQLYAPFRTIMSVSESNGALAAHKLACLASNDPPTSYVHISLPEIDGYNAPLGWTLSLEHVKMIFEEAKTNTDVNKVVDHFK